MRKVKNAIIMAAGTSSRFAPLSYEIHKGLIEVKGEILVERQIRQLREAGIEKIIIVTGYKAKDFDYLKDKYGVVLMHNQDYILRNNNGSIQVAKEYIGDSYICSVDNYFSKNPFEQEVEESYYSAIYTRGKTKEWCLEEDEKGYINQVTIGGEDSWYMLGHTFWTREFAQVFFDILDGIYEKEETRELLWESIYKNNLDVLKMKIKKYQQDFIYEFDTLDELREFDVSYVTDTRSKIVKDIAMDLNVRESDISDFKVIQGKTNEAIGFSFRVDNEEYEYIYSEKMWMRKG